MQQMQTCTKRRKVVLGGEKRKEKEEKRKQGRRGEGEFGTVAAMVRRGGDGAGKKGKERMKRGWLGFYKKANQTLVQ